VNILKPGCGVGGHCIAVDPWFLVETFPEQTALLQAARQVNDAKPYEVLQTIKVAVSKSKNMRPRVLLLGLTYKADVDDLRESPAMIIAQAMKSWEHCEFMVCEPHVQPSKLQTMFANQVVALEQGLKQADVIVSLVGHQAFKDVTKQLKAHQQIIDFCGLTHEVKKDVQSPVSIQKNHVPRLSHETVAT